MRSRFDCGHENPLSNRYCDECGEPRDPRCPLCHSPNRTDAKFCGACGARLLDEQVVPGPETPPSTKGRRWQRGDFERAPIDRAAGEDGWPSEERWRKPLLLTVAAIVAVFIGIALAVVQFGPARHPDRSGQRFDPASPDSGALSSPRESPTEAVAPAPDTVPAPDTASAPSGAEASTRNTSLPTRLPNEARAASGEEGRRSPAFASAPQTSEERMADFLVQELGPAQAADKALSTAAWYDVDRPEYAYWERVSGAIRRREGR